MKLLTLILSLLFATPVFAAPGVGPVVPWPTGIDRSEILPDELEGYWTAYDQSNIWSVHIEADAPYRIAITMAPVRADKKAYRPEGLGYWGRHVFWGHVNMDGEHYSSMLIYRDKEGLKLRIAISDQRFYEFRMVRATRDKL